MADPERPRKGIEALLQPSLDFYHPRWPVFYEDNHILSIYKPAGLLMQADRSGAPCLLELARQWIKERHRKPGRAFLGLVHRLDRPVAGIVLFARTSKAASRISEQIREGRIRKSYLAVVEGRLPSPSGELFHRMASKGQRPKEARLFYQTLETAGPHALVSVQLKTGRKHQIRFQFSQIGCPVAGDVRYGASRPLPSSQIALFSKTIGFLHPTRPEEITLSSPVPEGWPWAVDDPGVPKPLWNWDAYARSINSG